MLKPEHNILVLAKILERAVAVGKITAEGLIGAPAEGSERLSANVRQFAQGAGLRHGAVMQAILPGNICSRKSDLPEGAGDGLAIGDMQHQEKANIGGIAIIAGNCQTLPKLKPKAWYGNRV